jgi:hypothetical protein
MRIGTDPAAPHTTIDNRLGADTPVATQVRILAGGARTR